VGCRSSDLVGRFYDEVENDPVLLDLYPDKDDLAPARRRLTLFLAQYWGGPQTYSDERGHPRLRMRHAPFRIGPAERDAWLLHMRAALDTLHLPEPHQSALWEYLDMAAESMRNKRLTGRATVAPQRASGRVTEFTLARRRPPVSPVALEASSRQHPRRRVRAGEGEDLHRRGVPVSKLRWGVAGLVMLSVGVLAIPASAASRSVFKARGKELSAVVTSCPANAPAGTQCEAWLVFASQERITQNGTVERQER
jgi:hemoglobin